MMTLVPPTGMLDKCILSQARSLSISTSYLLQLCSTETTIQGAVLQFCTYLPDYQYPNIITGMRVQSTGLMFSLMDFSF